MFRKALAILAVAAFAVTAAQAAGVNGATLSKDGRITTTQPGAMHYTPGFHKPAALDTIFDNIGFLYPEGLYFCCFGNTISGPSSQVGGTNWPAAQFTPAHDATVKAIDVALGWVSGSNRVVINIAKDDGGVPGTVLASFPALGLGAFGDCCQLAQVAGNLGLRVKAGTPYWLFMSTDSESSNTWAVWPYNSTDQVNTINTAGYNGTQWTAFPPARPAVSFAIYGKNKP